MSGKKHFLSFLWKVPQRGENGGLWESCWKLVTSKKHHGYWAKSASVSSAGISLMKEVQGDIAVETTNSVKSHIVTSLHMKNGHWWQKSSMKPCLYLLEHFLNFLKLDVWNFSPKKYDIVNHKSFSISSLFCLHLFFVSLSLPFFSLSSSVFVSFFSLPLCLSHNLCWLTGSLKVKVKQLLKEFVFRQMTSHLKKLHLESFQSNGLRLLDSLPYRFNELSYARVNYNS